MQSGAAFLAKRLGFRLAAIAIGCAVAILVCELGLRLSNVWIGRHSDTMFSVIEHDGQLGWKMKPSIQAEIDLADVEDTPVKSNAEGFWDKEFTSDKYASKYRIAFLGDSFTWGMGVREEERFSNIVARSTSAWESLNFGMPGYGVDQSLLVWRNVAGRYKPDLLVLTVFHNDYVDNIYSVRFGRRKPYFELKDNGSLELKGVPVESGTFWDDGVYNHAAEPYASLISNPVEKRSRVAHWLVKNSDLARFLYTLTKGRLADSSPSEATPEIDAPTPIVELSEAEQLQVRLLSKLVDQLAREVGMLRANLLVVLAGNLTPQFQVQKKAFSREGLQYVDATTEVIAARLGHGERVYYPYTQHWTPAGHRIVAQLITNAIRHNSLRASH